MELNDAGIALVKQFEGCKLQAYPDPGTGGAPYTVGYGHTGSDVTPDTVWTQEQADKALASDLEHTANIVSHLLSTSVSDEQFSALVSFAYNVGVHNLASSTLLKLTNSRDFTQAAPEFLKWHFAAGKDMPGLLNRRIAEKELYES